MRKPRHTEVMSQGPEPVSGYELKLSRAGIYILNHYATEKFIIRTARDWANHVLKWV